MTAILAAPFAGRVIVGSDRALTDANAHSICSVGPKVLRCGDWLIGLAGAYLGDWEALASIEPPDSPTEWGQIIEPEDESCLLLVRGTVIRYGEVYAGHWCWGTTRGACSIGSGGNEVRASWLALRDYEPDPEKRMRRALSATAQVNTTVRGPFDVIWS